MNIGTAACQHLSDRVDVAVSQQLLLQRAEELVEVSWLAAVRRGHALLQLITVLLQLPKSLILEHTHIGYQLVYRGIT